MYATLTKLITRLNTDKLGNKSVLKLTKRIESLQRMKQFSINLVRQNILKFVFTHASIKNIRGKSIRVGEGN